MYYMIHATDHPEAPKLMERVYNKALQVKEPLDQLQLELGLNGYRGRVLYFDISPSHLRACRY
jgi:hypothetical protein